MRFERQPVRCGAWKRMEVRQQKTSWNHLVGRGSLHSTACLHCLAPMSLPNRSHYPRDLSFRGLLPQAPTA